GGVLPLRSRAATAAAACPVTAPPPGRSRIPSSALLWDTFRRPRRCRRIRLLPAHLSSDPCDSRPRTRGGRADTTRRSARAAAHRLTCAAAHACARWGRGGGIFGRGGGCRHGFAG